MSRHTCTSTTRTPRTGPFAAAAVRHAATPTASPRQARRAARRPLPTAAARSAAAGRCSRRRATPPRLSSSLKGPLMRQTPRQRRQEARRQQLVLQAARGHGRCPATAALQVRGCGACWLPGAPAAGCRSALPASSRSLGASPCSSSKSRGSLTSSRRSRNWPRTSCSAAAAQAAPQAAAAAARRRRRGARLQPLLRGFAATSQMRAVLTWAASQLQAVRAPLLVTEAQNQQRQRTALSRQQQQQQQHHHHCQ